MKILFVQKRLLFPADTGGKIRTLNIVRPLARTHDITYLCNVQPGEEAYFGEMRGLGVRLETIPWRETPRGSVRFFAQLGLNVFSPYPFSVAKDYDHRLRRRAAELVATESFDLIVCDFAQMARNVQGIAGPARVLFQHNVESEIFRRHAERDRGWLRRLYMRLQWTKMQRYESRLGNQFDRVVAVSARDREVFEREFGWNHVDVIDTPVDVDYFSPESEGTEIPNRIVFVGSMDWLPNEDGVSHFVWAIWPLIQKQHPAAMFQIVGRRPSLEVRQLARYPGVEVTGTVPDVRPHLAKAAVVIIPLSVGSGTRLKIFEALAMRKAIVSTSLGVEGLPLVPGEHLLIADEPIAFANAVSKLLDDRAERRRLAQNGHRLVVENYSAAAVAAQFDRICHNVVSCRSVRKSQSQSAPCAETSVPRVSELSATGSLHAS